MIRHFRNIVFPLLALALLLMPAMRASAAQDATPEAECVTTTPEEIKVLATEYWNEVVWGAQGQVAEYVAPDAVYHWGMGTETAGFEAFSETFGGVLAAFPDIEFAVNRVAAEGDLVATAWTAAGTQRGEWQDIAPTNTPIVLDGINIFRFACGKIVESWGEANNIGLLAQLGSPDVPAFFADVAESKAAPMTDASAATPCASDTPEANVALVERWFTDVWTGKNFEVLDEIAAPDIVHHAGGFPDSHGAEAVKNAVRGFPEADLGVDAAFTDGDLVVVRWSGMGTLGGDFLGDQPSDQVVPMTGINIHRVICGKIVEGWSEISGLSMLKQVQAEAAAGAATPTD